MLLKKITIKKIKDKLKTLVLGTPLVRTLWFLQLKAKVFFAKNIRVGFGPITTGENDLAERKWRIDPIVDRINQSRAGYTAGIFVDPQEMKNFDIVILVKKFNPSFFPVIEKLKQGKTRFIYDIVDNPNSEEKYRFYFADYPQFCQLMDGFILSSPLHKPLIEPFSKPAQLIEHPIINSACKKDYDRASSIRILAHGHYANLVTHKIVEPLLPLISEELGIKVYLVYHSEKIFPDTDFVKYVKWTKENCFKEMVKADFAITIKDLYAPHQKTKPSTKIISFMAAGLPVICTPTEADCLVMENGKTGFFAYTLEDWKASIKMLARDEKLREQIGRASRAEVQKKYNLEQVVDKYIKFLNQVMHVHS